MRWFMIKTTGTKWIKHNLYFRYQNLALFVIRYAIKVQIFRREIILQFYGFIKNCCITICIIIFNIYSFVRFYNGLLIMVFMQWIMPITYSSVKLIKLHYDFSIKTSTKISLFSSFSLNKKGWKILRKQILAFYMITCIFMHVLNTCTHRYNMDLFDSYSCCIINTVSPIITD